MPNGAKRWQVADPVPVDHLARFPDLNPLVVQVLHNRGLTDPREVSAFLSAQPGLDDPSELLGMARAVEQLRAAIGASEPIAVYGDFDADGVTATALLVLALGALGADVRPYIPHRVDEGYGLHQEALAELHAQGVRVVVTVDCGVRAVEEVAYARQLGMDVIVTDHHTVGPTLPEATAVINPRQPGCSYPYKHLAGVGLAFKLAQALIQAERQDPVGGDGSAGPLIEEGDFLDLVALGTVADLAPLTGENRSLVSRGLRLLNESPRPGIEALMRRHGTRGQTVDEDTIGYVLGPRLNAAGRMAHASLAYELLVAEYPAEADRLSERLDVLNRDRRQLTADVLERAWQTVQAEGTEQSLLFVSGPDYPAGVVGLVASRLLEAFHRPAVIVNEGEHESHGSARSIPEFHVARALDACADLLLRYGGHRLAAGFTVRTEDLPRLRHRLMAQAEQELAGRDLTPIIHADAEVPLSEMSWDLLEQLERLRPFGQENPEPLFVSRDVEVRQFRPVGPDGAHLKLYLSDGRAVWDGIAFRQGQWADRLPDRVDVVYHLQRNDWMGESRLQLNVQDIWAAGLEEVSG